MKPLKRIISKGKEDYPYTMALSFQERSELDYAMEAIKCYPKLQRIIEEWEDELRSWRKYGRVPEEFSEVYDESKELWSELPYKFEQFWYRIRKEFDPEY